MESIDNTFIQIFICEMYVGFYKSLRLVWITQRKKWESNFHTFENNITIPFYSFFHSLFVIRWYGGFACKRDTFSNWLECNVEWKKDKTI